MYRSRLNRTDLASSANAATREEADNEQHIYGEAMLHKLKGVPAGIGTRIAVNLPPQIVKHSVDCATERDLWVAGMELMTSFGEAHMQRHLQTDMMQFEHRRPRAASVVEDATKLVTSLAFMGVYMKAKVRFGRKWPQTSRVFCLPEKDIRTRVVWELSPDKQKLMSCPTGDELDYEASRLYGREDDLIYIQLVMESSRLVNSEWLRDYISNFYNVGYINGTDNAPLVYTRSILQFKDKARPTPPWVFESYGVVAQVTCDEMPEWANEVRSNASCRGRYIWKDMHKRTLNPWAPHRAFAVGMIEDRVGTLGVDEVDVPY